MAEHIEVPWKTLPIVDTHTTRGTPSTPDNNGAQTSHRSMSTL
jgi:hypothetical protein